MSNEQKRTVKDIHNEYSQLCAKAGHLQYQVSVLSSDLALVNEQLKSLNIEAASASKEEQKAEASNA